MWCQFLGLLLFWTLQLHICSCYFLALELQGKFHVHPIHCFWYLRNGKHVLCFYRVIEKRVEVWENKKWCGNTSRMWVFSQLFRVLPNFHECFFNLIETRRTCFLFLLENTATKKRETTCLLWSSKCKFSLLAPSLWQHLVLVLCFYRVLVEFY